jgi:hypothetical protein
MKPSQEKSVNLATPGKPMTQEAFKKMIKEAEEGVFHTLNESKTIFKEWRSKLEK